MTADHTPSTTFVNNPCSCCGITMGCGIPKVFPTTLNFVVSIGGSCPEAVIATLSGVATLAETGATCLDCFAKCGCRYEWDIDPDDIPACGPFISSLALACLDPIVSPIPPHDSIFGPVLNCPHLKYEKCYFSAFVYVSRHTMSHLGPGVCGGEDDPQHAEQSCVDCMWDCRDGLGPPVPCPDCAPCYSWSNCTESRPGSECCGTDGCEKCESPFCFFNPCNRCHIQVGAADPLTNPDCEEFCDGNMYAGTEVYNYWLTDCPDPLYLRGLNPTTCPPDDKNTGDFFIHIGCNDNDYVEFSCP